ncbi:hypothetical protein M885DRAFT_523865 [Pelagophyceae sp. CCMP2097]|nr:hypothetical protein M885DRAFT_523865 [Pelagophyceae sp. CCMP2097]
MCRICNVVWFSCKYAGVASSASSAEFVVAVVGRVYDAAMAVAFIETRLSRMRIAWRLFRVRRACSSASAAPHESAKGTASPLSLSATARTGRGRGAAARAPCTPRAPQAQARARTASLNVAGRGATSSHSSASKASSTNSHAPSSSASSSHDSVATEPPAGEAAGAASARGVARATTTRLGHAAASPRTAARSAAMSAGGPASSEAPSAGASASATRSLVLRLAQGRAWPRGVRSRAPPQVRSSRMLRRGRLARGLPGTAGWKSAAARSAFMSWRPRRTASFSSEPKPAENSMHAL